MKNLCLDPSSDHSIIGFEIPGFEPSIDYPQGIKCKVGLLSKFAGLYSI